MRLIDADALIERLAGFCQWCRDARLQGAEFCLDCVIPNAPTIEPSEQVTSKLKKPCDSLLKGDSDECKEHKSKLDSDLIRRSDAVEAVVMELDAIDHLPQWMFDRLTYKINSLPSADRPTVNKDGMNMEQAVEYCKDCQHDEVCRYYPYDGCAFKDSDRPTGNWVSEVDTGTWMLKCSVCGCRVQEEPYRVAVGETATRCPYCGAELGLGGYAYDEYADRPSERSEGGGE